MKLTVTCQTCGSILAIVQKSQVTSDDISLYEEMSYCTTVAGQGTDDSGNPITLYDGNSNIQATMTVN